MKNISLKEKYKSSEEIIAISRINDIIIYINRQEKNTNIARERFW